MTRRSRTLVAAVLGLSVGLPLAGRGAEPAPSGGLPALPPANKAADPAPKPPTPPGNRQIATAITEVLGKAGKAGQLRYYNIDVTVKDGTTELTGTVASQQQREEVLKLVKGVAGVGQVVDKMGLLAPSPITQVQATGPVAPAFPAPPAAAAPAPPPPPAEQVPPPPMREPLPPPAGGVIPEPVPTFAAPMPSPYDLNPPLMPPYAWPTYAPYNNFSRVAYPLAYPYQSWPFIGPYYPFPKIPPGWRSVKLEWEDGHWWFSKVATKCDWWRLRFW
jgi:hypothetical protein